MSNKKIDVFQKFSDVEMQRMQVVYLNDVGFSVADIKRWSDYAESTIRNYIRKFADLLDKAKKIFYHVTQKTKKVLVGGRQLVYLFKFYESNGNLICSKVGTTTRLPEQRLKEEIRYYREHDLPVANAEICSVIDCGAIPAEGAESYARAEYIKKYPDKFKKNDRFFGVDLSTRTFNKLIATYLDREDILSV